MFHSFPAMPYTELRVAKFTSPTKCRLLYIFSLEKISLLQISTQFKTRKYSGYMTLPQQACKSHKSIQKVQMQAFSGTVVCKSLKGLTSEKLKISFNNALEYYIKKIKIKYNMQFQLVSRLKFFFKPQYIYFQYASLQWEKTTVKKF